MRGRMPRSARVPKNARRFWPRCIDFTSPAGTTIKRDPKFPDFDYACPKSLDEALELLEAHGEDAAILAGGQSLMPVLAFRLAAPGILVDIKKVPGLDGIATNGDGVRLGANVRWCDILASGELRAAHPLLVEAIGHVAHYQIRNRGTVGGSLAYADPKRQEWRGESRT